MRSRMKKPSHSTNYRVSSGGEGLKMQIVDRLFLKRLMLAGTRSLAIAFLLMTGVTQPARAQTYKVIHNFAGPQDGEHPYSGLTNDITGNLYGTTNGEVGSGTVFE